MDDQCLKILLVDDQKLITESLHTFLTNYADDMSVTGIAANGKEAVDQVREKHPDIILMDVIMPVMNGVEAVSLIKTEYPDIKILMLSTYADDEYVHAAIMAGASGYLLKDTSPTELITVIRALKNDVIQISPEIARSLVQQKYKGEGKAAVIGDDPGGVSESLPWLKTLTNREREIFTLLATGYDNEEIAEKLFLAVQTVKNHVSVIYSKLGVKDRFEIIRLANQL